MNRMVVVNSDVEYSASANLNEHTMCHAAGLHINHTAKERTEAFPAAAAHTSLPLVYMKTLEL